jgi:hypothetical protein
VTETCGCCRDALAGAPLVYNRPGLSTIDYRIGTFSTFRRAMMASISRETVDRYGTPTRPFVVRPWITRDGADQGIATLEMFAYVADVLTFYQQTTANEAFLPTAKLRESILSMAATLGYVPAPGQAAVALLAFTLEKQKQLRVPGGLRVQSVPGAGEKPQKFETVETVEAEAGLNTVRVFPPPQTSHPLAPPPAGAPSAAVLLRTAPLQRPVVVGSRVVVFDEGAKAAEDKEIVALRQADGRTTVEWSPAIQAKGASPRMFQWRDKLRLSGQNAPATFLVPTLKSPVEVTFQEVKTEFKVGSTATSLNLDGVYPNLRKGQALLIRAPETVRLVTLGAAVEVSDALGGLATTVTQVQFGPSTIGADIADRRTVSVYVLGEEVRFEADAYAPAIGPGDALFLEAPSPAIAPGRLLILDDELHEPRAATVTSVVPSSSGLALTVTPPLSRALDTATAFLYGNVVRATHGETVPHEVLGNGDASATFQAFRLAKSPVTHVPAAGADHGAASTLVVRVDGVEWKEVPTFYGRSGKERVFTTERDNDEVTTVRFGDGVTGARATSGRANVAARYRHGLGTAGNLKAGVLRNALDRPVGLRSVINPLPSGGGTDPETLGEARGNAPNTVRTFGRVVSLRDFEDSARAFNGIAKARAASEWDGELEEQVVFLTVAGDGGAVPTQEVLGNLVADLDRRRDRNRGLRVTVHRSVPVSIRVAILVAPEFVVADVQKAAQEALVASLAFEHVQLGQAVHLSDVFAVVQAVAGVAACDVDKLEFKDPADRTSHGASADAVQPRLRIFPGELPALEDPAGDAVITVGMP